MSFNDYFSIFEIAFSGNSTYLIFKNLNMEQTLPETSIKRIKELLAILDPYALNWKEWTRSESCFLSSLEIKILQNYLLTGSNQQSSIEFNIPESTAASMLNKVERKLRTDFIKFENWLRERSAANNKSKNH